MPKRVQRELNPIAQDMAAVMVASGHTQQEVAEVMGVTGATVGRWVKAWEGRDKDLTGEIKHSLHSKYLLLMDRLMERLGELMSDPSQLGSYKLPQLVMALAILQDKARLVAGEPTQLFSVSQRVEDMSKQIEELKQAEQRLLEGLEKGGASAEQVITELGQQEPKNEN